MHGWWYKPMFFDKNLTQQGNILFFDLDVVIHNNIDKLFLFNPDSSVHVEISIEVSDLIGNTLIVVCLNYAQEV